jgi:hypothetical protein
MLSRKSVARAAVTPSVSAPGNDPTAIASNRQDIGQNVPVTKWSIRERVESPMRVWVDFMLSSWADHKSLSSRF